MPRISSHEFARLRLRVHNFLAEVPLHDAWVIDLPHWCAGITLDEFLRAVRNRPSTPLPLVRVPVNTRLLIGQVFGWVVLLLLEGR